MKFTQELELDIFSQNTYRYINAKQADNITRFVKITMSADGEKIEPEEGVTAYFRALKEDGKSVLNPATINEDGTVTVELTEQVLAYPGMVDADVSLVKGDEVLSVLSFYIQVEKAPVGSAVASDNEFLALVEATVKANKAADDARKAAEEAGQSKEKVDTAEVARAKAEADRVTAEQGRQNAEQTRQTEHTAAMGEAAEATQQATDAAAMAKELAEHPDDPRNGTWWRWDLEQHAYVDTGQRAVLNYDKVYPSVEAMEGDADNQPPSTTAIISTDVNIEDNAKLYVKRTDGTWGFIADLSGFPGVGIESVKQTAGDHTPGTTDTYTIKLTDERQIEVPVYNGSNGQDGEVSIDQLTAAVETARSRSWDVVVPAEGWIESAATWGDLTAKWETTIEVPDMTDIPDIIKIDFVDGSRQANGRWTWVACDVGSVTLYSTHNTPPESEFTTRITEVR